MKKEYTKPTIEVYDLDIENIITTSAVPKSLGGFQEGDNNQDFEDFFGKKS